MKFKVGDKVRCIKYHKLEFVGQEFEITHINGYQYGRAQRDYVFDDDELKLLSSTLTTTPMKQLTSMLKRILDADSQTLYKAGFLNGDLKLTEQGQDALNSILFSANKAELVKLAQENLDEEKSNN